MNVDHLTTDILLQVVSEYVKKQLSLTINKITPFYADTAMTSQQAASAVLSMENGTTIEGTVSIAKYLLHQAGCTNLLGKTDCAAIEIVDWTNIFMTTTCMALKHDRKTALSQLNTLFSNRIFTVGTTLSLADLALFSVLYNTPFRISERFEIPNVFRHYDLIQHLVLAWKLESPLKLVEFDLNVPLVKPMVIAETSGKSTVKAATESTESAEKGSKSKSKDQSSAEHATTSEKTAIKAAKKASKADKTSVATPVSTNSALPDLSKLDIRIGTIVSVKRHPDAETLYVEEIDLGEATARVVVSGLVKYMSESALENRKVVVLCNLKPAKMRGIESQAMVLATTSSDGATVELLEPPAGSQNGDVCFFDGHKGTPEKQLNPKRKVWESIQPNFLTDTEFQAVYTTPDESKKVCVLKSDRGVCKVQSVAGGLIK
ncbi:G4 quadruplex nucleic acid binding protein [Batrachochytrium dendrobatidis]|nr:G4 quadruplex nucleic acid binding protein [Batrachochytrium dendrobatidis]KAK5673167.1 G4 quadruplex nucleic acid binding protein [Batrachochytrium dendrobatidis]